MVKNKIKALLLAICIALPAMFALTACGHKHEYSDTWSKDATYHWHACTGKDCDATADKSKHTFVEQHNETQYWQECSVCGYQKDVVTATVDNTTLANALDFKDADGNFYTNWQAECVNQENETIEITKQTEEAAYIYLRSLNPETSIYVNIETNSSVKYSKTNNADVKWTKTERASTYNLNTLAKSALSISDLKDLTFTYNTEDKMYHATQEITSTSTFKISSEYTLKFVNGKLVGITQKTTKTTLSTEESIVTGVLTWTISYGNATIELPTASEIAD